MFIRLGRVLLVMGAVLAGVVLAVGTGFATRPRAHHDRPVSASLAAQRTAVSRRWASTLCTSLLAWKNQIHRDATSLNLGFGPAARLRDATAATWRVLRILDKLGPPLAARIGRAGAGTARLRAELQSGARGLEQLAQARSCRQLAGIPF